MMGRTIVRDTDAVRQPARGRQPLPDSPPNVNIPHHVDCGYGMPGHAMHLAGRTGRERGYVCRRPIGLSPAERRERAPDCCHL